MSAIKTVYVLYKAITQGLKQGNEEVLKSNAKVFKSLKNTSEYTEDFVNKIKGLAKEIAVASGLVYTASQFIGDFKEALNYGRELSVTSKVLNINAEELQAWGNVLNHVGGDVNTFKKNVFSLADYFNVRPDTALTYLPMLAKAFSQVNAQQAKVLGDMFHLDPEFVLLLRQGSSALTEMLNAQKNLGLATQQDVDNFGKLNDVMIDAKNASKGLFMALAIDATPGLNKLFGTIEKTIIFLRAHLSDFETGLKGIGIGIVGVLSVIIPPLGAFAAAILAVVAAYKSWDAIQSVFSSSGALGSEKNNGLMGESFSDVVGLKPKLLESLQKFLPESASPIATQPASNIKNSQSTVNYTQNNNIENLNTNIKDAAGFAKQLSNVGNFSPAYQNSIAQNNMSSGVQA
jgi:hypothetical protein